MRPDNVLVVRCRGVQVALVAQLCACAASGAMRVEPNPTLREGFGRVLIVGPASDLYEATIVALKRELDDEFDVLIRRTSADPDSGSLQGWLEEVAPAAVVLLNNDVVRLYRALQTAEPQRVTPPAVVIMTSYLRELYLDRLRNATGISYEVPAQTAFVRLRSVLGRPLSRVGVVVRPALKKFFARQAELMEREGFTCVPAMVGNRPTARQVEGALRGLVDGAAVDALWVLNDNTLLSPDMLARGWLPALERAAIPVVVGVQSLISTTKPFGHFAALPDHAALGVQAADMLFALAEERWRVAEVPPQDPISVRTAIDVKSATRLFGVSLQAIETVDVPIGR